MVRRILLAAVTAASIAGFGGTPSASAHCRYNVGGCYGGHCYVNAGTCYGSCYINGPFAYCGSGASCTVNLGVCTDPAVLVNLCSLLPDCEG